MRETDQLKLDLNESLFFETGYEIAEMINISLTPEISIQSFNDYMSIRGVVELSGQYIKDNELSEEPISTDDHAHQWIKKVRNKPNNQVEFSHFFPIDISVPLNRITNVDDVSVKIVSFDYDIKQPDHLKIYSTVHINGIHDEAPPSLDEEREKEMLLDDEFSLEMLPMADVSLSEEQSVDRQEETSVINQADNNHVSQDKDQVDEEKKDDNKLTRQQEENVIQLVSKENASSESIEELEADEQAKKETKSLSSASEKVDIVRDQEVKEKTIDSSIEEDQDLIHIEDSQHTVEEMAQTDEEQSDVKDVSYLAHIFQSEDEKSFVNMRLYIVQNQDTIESIADRYEVEPLKIMNENNLQDDHLSAGQLLYIPQGNV